MEPEGNIVINIIFLITLILMNAFFAMSEIAIISLNDNKLKKLADEGDKKASQVLKLTKEPSKFLATIQVGVTLSGFFASALAADSFANVIVYWLRGTALPSATVRAVSILVITLILAYFTLVFGELVPKRIGMKYSEQVAFIAVPVLRFVAFIGTPFVALLSVSTNAMLRLIGINPEEVPEAVTEEEIRMMLDVGNENGSIEQSDRQMIHSIFEFDDTSAEEMMTHRTEIEGLDVDTPLDEVIKVAMETGYSRIPIYQDDIDSIIGILYVKDLLGLIEDKANKTFNLKDYIREPLYILETTTGDVILEQFKKHKVQVAVLVDEYGGTSGMITMEDLMEFIVGNIQDEFDQEEEDIVALDDGSYLVDGLAPLDVVAGFFSIVIDEEDDENFDTIGGYLLNSLGYIPGPEEKPVLEIQGTTFEVQSIEERRIDKVRVIKSNNEKDMSV